MEGRITKDVDFCLPAPTKLASILDTAATLLYGGCTTAEEAIHLSNEQFQHPVTRLDVLQSGERVGGCQDTVGVDSRLTVQSVPDDRRKIEQHRLQYQQSTSISRVKVTGI